MRRDMATIIPLPSIAAMRLSKCQTISAAIRWMRSPASDERLELRPLRLGLPRIAQVVFFKVFVQILDELSALVAQGDFGEAALIVDPDGRVVVHGLGDIVDVHIVAENSRRVDIRFPRLGFR